MRMPIRSWNGQTRKGCTINFNFLINLTAIMMVSKDQVTKEEKPQMLKEDAKSEKKLKEAIKKEFNA